MAGWGVSIGGGSLTLGNISSVVMVTTFPVWLTGQPMALIVMTAPVASNIGSTPFAKNSPS